MNKWLWITKHVLSIVCSCEHIGGSYLCYGKQDVGFPTKINGCSGTLSSTCVKQCGNRQFHGETIISNIKIMIGIKKFPVELHLWHWSWELLCTDRQMFLLLLNIKTYIFLKKNIKLFKKNITSSLSPIVWNEQCSSA